MSTHLQIKLMLYVVIGVKLSDHMFNTLGEWTTVIPLKHHYNPVQFSFLPKKCGNHPSLTNNKIRYQI